MGAKQMPYVLSDCDGTISNSKFEVSAATKKSIIKYQKKSENHFSFITGRLGVSSKVLARELKITLPVISCNGALITNLETGKVLHADYLKKQLVLKIVAESYQAGIEPFVYTAHQMAGIAGNPRLILWKQYRETLKKKDYWTILEYGSLEEFLQAIESEIIVPVEILLYAPSGEQQDQARQLLKKYARQIEGNQSLPFLFNITCKGVNKLSGLKKWAKIMKTNYKNIMTFGDNYNDIPMIKGVKHGIVVGNGVEAAKKVAFKVIPPMTENGVGQELERIIEKYE